MSHIITIETISASSFCPSMTMPAGKGKIKVETFRLKEAGFSDVLFVYLSGARNSLPSQKSLNEILKIINNSNY